MLRKILRKTLLILACFIGVILVFLAFAISPIDRYEIKDQDFYKVMVDELDTLRPQPHRPSTHGFSVGYAKVSITPKQRTSLAGYGNRRGNLYSEVHDSIFVRTLVITTGDARAAIVSADLLIIPPTVTELLEKELPSIDFTINNTYLGATHTHNSIGNWGHGVTGILYGSYSDSIVRFITDQIKKSIHDAAQNSLPAKLRSGAFPLNIVRNRMSPDGGLDSLVHLLEVNRSDSSKLILMSYTAHATCISNDDLSLSRDYPGVLVDELEKQGYDMAMFMAGAVGSHTGTSPKPGWDCVAWMPNAIVDRFKKNKGNLEEMNDSTLVMYRIPLLLGSPQAKVTEDLKMRPWLFRAAFGEYPVYLTALRIGNLVMMGTPCDYSGELTAPLYDQAHGMGLSVLVTSFNGGYIGYITPDKYYDVNHYETRLMNWYGPGSGSYLSGSLKKLLDVTSK